MYEFTYQRADSIEAAQTALAADSSARLLAGGMTLLPSMKHRLSAPSQLIDIARLDALRGIRRDGDTLTVGAGMKHQEVAADATVHATIPALASLAGVIGDPQVRARGTLGGSLANNDPAADYPAAVLGLAGTVITQRRELAAEQFFQGLFATALEADELVVAVRFRVPRRAQYAKFAHPASGYAMTGVLVAEFATEIRVAVTGAGPGVFRWTAAEAALGKGFAESALQGLEHPADDLNADLHAPASYRAHLIGVMTRRAVAAMTARRV